MRRVVKTAYAMRDLDRIYDYSADRWGMAQARHYVSDVDKAIARLLASPELGHSRDDVPEPYLAYAVGKHVIIYSVEPDTLTVLTIPHQAMDIERRMHDLLQTPKLH